MSSIAFCPLRHLLARLLQPLRVRQRARLANVLRVLPPELLRLHRPLLEAGAVGRARVPAALHADVHGGLPPLLGGVAVLRHGQGGAEVPGLLLPVLELEVHGHRADLPAEEVAELDGDEAAGVDGLLVVVPAGHGHRVEVGPPLGVEGEPHVLRHHGDQAAQQLREGGAQVGPVRDAVVRPARRVLGQLRQQLVVCAFPETKGVDHDVAGVDIPGVTGGLPLVLAVGHEEDVGGA